MKGTALTRLTGIILVAIGLLAMLGWYTHIRVFISLYPGQTNIVFNSAMAFFLMGTSLLVPELKIQMQQKICSAIGVFVALLGIITLGQYIFNYSLGIDQLLFEPWLIDQNPYPGRMAYNSAYVFLFAGIALCLFPYMAKKNIALLAKICIFSTLILGFSALIGYAFDAKVLYSWNLYTQMSLPSAIGSSFLGLGLWSLWHQKEQEIYPEVVPGEEGKQAISLGLTILFCTALMSSFAILKILPAGAHPVNYLAQIKSAIFVAIMAGMGILLWQLVPLIGQMVNSEKKLFKANSLLKESENRFRSAFDDAAVGMALVLPNGTFLKVNKSLCTILGYSENNLLEIDIYSIIHLEDLQENKIRIGELLDRKNKTYEKVQRYLHKNGEIVWAIVSMSLVCNSQNLPLYFIMQVQNITPEKKAEEQLLHLAYHDALTGLYNRNFLEKKVQDILSNAARHNYGFALIFLDLDRFKNINDTLGHDAGDLLLQIVGQRLKNKIRTNDVIARVGGDEFVLILNELNQVDKISNVIRNIIAHLSQPISIKGHEIYITTSIGISVYPYDGSDVQTLMKNADLALYRSKELGRNNFQFCTLEMTTKAQQKMKRQNALLQAMAKDEFILYFQPKLNLSNQLISGVEALLRWQNPEFSNVDASEIIHLAEDTGLIIPLNEWVFTTACLQVKAWHQAGFTPLSLSVNLSGKQFKQANFIENLQNLLKRAEFSPNSLELDITEGLIMQDPEYILPVLLSLKEKGINIAIDDFGTGYSSLDYLRRFSIDKIKIDRKFIQRLTVDAASTSVVSAIIAMSNKLGIKTVAEGVETREQYDFLLQEKCTEIQGYYISQPADVETITRFLKNPVIQQS